MALLDVDTDLMASRLSLIKRHLDERGGAEAKASGRGGISVVAKVSGFTAGYGRAWGA